MAEFTGYKANTLEDEINGILVSREMIKEYGVRDAVNLSLLYFDSDKIKKLDSVILDSVIRELKKKKLIEVIEANPHIVQKFLESKKLDGFGIGKSKCEWCKIKTVTTHNHHFPIHQKDGGKDIVKICPNCHQEYHSLMQKHNFIFPQKVKESFNKLIAELKNIKGQ